MTDGTPPEQNEAGLCAAFLPITDPHERLSAIVAGCAGPGLPAGERQASALVAGCVSRVWIAVEVAEGVLTLHWDAESPMVRGLAGLLCAVYQGCPAAAVLAHRSGILTALRLDRALSPTRLRGLAALEARIHQLAHSAAGEGGV